MFESNKENWDEDDIYDGQQKTSEIEVLVFEPNKSPINKIIPNTLKAMQEVVGGTICVFQTGVGKTVGVCNDDGIALQLPLNRLIEPTGALIFGVFFVARDGVNFHSLSLKEQEELKTMKAFTNKWLSKCGEKKIIQEIEALKREDD